MAETERRNGGRGASKAKAALWYALLGAASLVILAAEAGGATSIRDIARPLGARENKLKAVGMVLGLKGTGDGSKSLPTLRALGSLLQRFGAVEQDLVNLNGDNAALVHVSVTVPENGARQGDKLDAYVSAISAKSLKGGRLVLCPVVGPAANSNKVYALAEGPIVLEDVSTPTVGVIKGGSVVEEDIIPEYLSGGRFTLVVDADHAGWEMASSLAKVINDAEAEPGTIIATAVNPTSIVVTVPIAELADPADFIARILSLPVLLPDPPARVVINRRTGGIVITDDVEIDPVILSHAALTIATILPEPVPTAEAPVTQTKSFVAFDPRKKASASLKDLLDAFNQLQVPAKDRIEIIDLLRRSGRLHAQVKEE